MVACAATVSDVDTLESQDDDYIVLDRQRADGNPPPVSSVKEIHQKHVEITSSSDYVLVEQAAVYSSFEKYGTHLLVWLGVATSIWGGIFVLTLSTVRQSRKQFDATGLICIPMLMVWALYTMWTAYKKRNYCKALVLSALPILVLTAILVWWYFPV